MHLQVEECQKLPTNHQKLGEKHRTTCPSQPLEGASPADTVSSDFYPSVTSVVEVTQCVVLCYGRSRKGMQLSLQT